MDTLAIYPYNESYAPFARHQRLITGMTIKSLISPRGWGMEGDEIKTDDGILKVTSDFESGIGMCTTVWIVDDAHIPLPEALLISKLNDALRQNKKIIWTRQSASQDITKMIPPENQIVAESIRYEHERINRACFDINTPVIFVLGLTDNTDKFEVQAALREQFIKKGYKVSSISSRKDSTILGMHPLPTFMFDNNICETEKILAYSHYVKQIEINEAPEIIIIGIPGGAFRLNKTQHNHFGITAFEISNALSCDCAILCLPYKNFTQNTDYFSKVSNVIQEKLGFAIDYHHIASRTNDDSTKQITETVKWLTLDEAFIEKKILQCRRSDVYNLLNQSSIEELTEKIIDQLSQTLLIRSI